MPATDVPRLRVLHAIHDFLPRHRAGAEIYAFELCRELSRRRHHVSVATAEFDLSRPHGHVTWRVQGGLPVVEIVNNWICKTFEDTYRSPAISEQLAHVLAAVQPDIVHIHSLLNLSFDLPALAHARDIPVVATLHDYTLVCPSGGQRVHRAEDHLCDTIDPDRCARCFGESPFPSQMTAGQIAAAVGGGGLLKDAVDVVKRRAPRMTRRLSALAARGTGVPVTASEIAARLQRARDVFEQIDLVVAPSQSIADQCEAFGLNPSRVRISDYGFRPLERLAPSANDGPLRIGYVGTLVWHKGVHVLVDAVSALPHDAYELRIFGDPHVFPDYTADLHRRAQGLPIHFMGAFDREAAAAVYAGLDVLVVPSIWLENSPLVIHEAFMAGVPVVGARIGGITELVTDGENGLLYEPRSSAELSVALRNLINDRNGLRAMAGCLPRVKSIETDATEWEAVYRELLDARRTLSSKP